MKNIIMDNVVSRTTEFIAITWRAQGRFMWCCYYRQLYKAEEVAQWRSSRSIGIEEFLFIMRRDKVGYCLYV